MDARRIAFLTLAATFALAAPAAAATDDDTSVIGPGTLVGGVDVGGQTISQAAVTLQTQLAPKLNAPVTVAVGSRRFSINGTRAKVRLDALRTARRAYLASRDAGTATTTTPVAPTTTTPAPAPTTTTPVAATRQAGGAASGLSVPAAVSVSSSAVRAWADQVAGDVTRQPRSAKLTIGLTRMRVTKARRGFTIDASALARRVVDVLGDPAAGRTLRQPLKALEPTTSLAALRRANSTILTVDRAHYTLRLFKNLRLSKTYGVAVGMAGLETPAGEYHITDKQVNPAWHVPNSAWAGSLAGQVIPGGASNNPLVARWLGIQDGIGIHGTNEPWSIGSSASHGCIRMRPDDVIDLYDRVPVGTPVLIR
jgi:lipoprotein-anchoring transpeptidase ErfK/SrfK